MDLFSQILDSIIFVELSNCSVAAQLWRSKAMWWWNRTHCFRETLWEQSSSCLWCQQNPLLYCLLGFCLQDALMHFFFYNIHYTQASHSCPCAGCHLSKKFQLTMSFPLQSAHTVPLMSMGAKYVEQAVPLKWVIWGSLCYMMRVSFTATFILYWH